MGALNALSPAISGVARNPILVGITALYGLVQLPQLALQSTDPVLASVVSLVITGVMILVFPFFQGGLLGMANEAIAGRTTIGMLVASGKANYVSLLLAYLVLLAINLVFGMLVFFGVLIGGIGLFAGGVTPGRTLLIVLGLVGLVVVLAYLLLHLFIQFYAHAIVLSDADLVDGFRTSVRLVRRNLLSVLGYTVILAIGGVLLGGIGVVASSLFGPGSVPGVPTIDPAMPFLVLAGLVYVAAVALFGAFYVTYSVAYYRGLRA